MLEGLKQCLSQLELLFHIQNLHSVLEEVAAILFLHSVAQIRSMTTTLSPIFNVREKFPPHNRQFVFYGAKIIINIRTAKYSIKNMLPSKPPHPMKGEVIGHPPVVHLPRLFS